MTKMTDRLEDKATTESLHAFFKAIPDDWYERTSGNVEAPSGWFGLVIITDEFITAWDEEELAGMAIPKDVAKGSYVVVVNNNGLVWAFSGTDEALDAEYERRDAEYSGWDGDEVSVSEVSVSHNKYCLAAAIICAVENLRDSDEYPSDADFVRMVNKPDNLVEMAQGYLDDKLTSCRCGMTGGQA